MADDKSQIVKKWWAQHVNDKPVWRTEKLPDDWYKSLLTDELKIGYEVRRNTIVLGKSNTDPKDLIRIHYWNVLSEVLQSYKPYAIGGIGAMRYHLGDRSTPKELNISTPTSSARIDLAGEWELIIDKSSELFAFPNRDAWYQEVSTTNGYTLTFETPESLLIRIRPKALKDFPDLVTSFLKAIEFNLEKLQQIMGQENKPVVFMRLAAYFDQFGRSKEAELIRKVVKSRTEYNPPGASAVMKYRIPTNLISPRIVSDPPYVTRFRDQLRYYSEILAAEAYTRDKEIHPLSDIVQNIQETRKYDAYHSSTIEGYRVTPEEIQAIIDGRETTDPGASPEEIERKMALKGYLRVPKAVRTLEWN
jgi:hypothetical protein